MQNCCNDVTVVGFFSLYWMQLVSMQKTQELPAVLALGDVDSPVCGLCGSTEGCDPHSSSISCLYKIQRNQSKGFLFHLHWKFQHYQKYLFWFWWGSQKHCRAEGGDSTTLSGRMGWDCCVKTTLSKENIFIIFFCEINVHKNEQLTSFSASALQTHISPVLSLV